MSGLFGVLDVANRGLAVTQQGIRVAGHNVANVNNPNYSRQRQIQAALAPIQSNSGHLGTGVEQLTIERVTDAFVEARLLEQNGSSASVEAQARALSLVEEVLNEQNGEGVGDALSRLYDAFSDLASSPAPGAPVERAAVRDAAVHIAQTLRSVDAQLRDLQRSTSREIDGLVPQINSIAERIAELNTHIVGLELQAPANDLRDERDALMRELASKIEIDSFEQPNGSLVVMLAGGLSLVNGANARALATLQDPANPFDPTFSRIVYPDGGIDIDVTADVGAGELGGLLRVRDTLVPSAIRSLDTLAYNLAGSVNAVHALGTGLDGSVGDFFVAPAAVEDAARDLAVEAAILANPDRVAAGLTPGPADNRNALSLAGLRDAAAPLFLPGDPPGPATGPTRTLLEHAGALVADVGEQARTLAQSSRQQARILEDLENRRDAASGVSIDEEMTGLIQLEAAFQANARVMNTVAQLLDDLLNIL